MKYRTVTVSAADAGVFAQALARRDLAFDLSAVHYEAISNFLLAWNQSASTEIEKLTVSEKRERENDP